MPQQWLQQATARRLGAPPRRRGHHKSEVACLLRLRDAERKRAHFVEGPRGDLVRHLGEELGAQGAKLGVGSQPGGCAATAGQQ